MISPIQTVTNVDNNLTHNQTKQLDNFLLQNSNNSNNE
jgi:hypothetical protein